MAAVQHLLERRASRMGLSDTGWFIQKFDLNATGACTLNAKGFESKQLAARHPQVGPRERGRELRGVLLQSAVADLHEAEPPFNHAE